MKLALLTQYYKPEMGAPQNRLFEMLSGLKQLGHEVVVVTGMPNYPTGKIFDNYKGKLFLEEKIDNIVIKRFWLYASNSKSKIPRIWNMISFSVMSIFSFKFLKRKQIDYLIVESPPLTLCITGYLLAKLTNASLVANISDLWPLSAKELGAISEKDIIYKALERLENFIYKKSDICMGQSAEIVDYIKEHGGKNVYLFRNGVDPNRFIDVKFISSEGNRKPKIVYAGLLGFAQGILDICKNINFRDLGIEFHIYGAGGEQELIQQYLLENSNKGIYYHGRVSRDEIPQKLSSADATLIPLVKNIFGAVPSKIYESMAAGVPILFSGEGEGQRIIEEFNLGWTSPAKDYNAMINNIRELMNNPKEASIKKENCKSCALNVFNRPKQIDALNEYLLKYKN